MENLIKISRAFYGAGIIGIGVQQFIYAEFRPVILEQWPRWIPWITVWAYIAGAALIIAGLIIAISKNAPRTAFVLGIAFLIFFLAFQVTHQLFNNTSFNWASWTNPLKELAFSGGAFIILASYPQDNINTNRSFRTRLADTFIPYGRIFFSIMMIVFGYDHFLYTKFVATLVPAWIPWHIFWTYFAGTALMGSGICIMFKFKLKLVGLLLGIMLFIWFVILHIPRAIADPYIDKGNEVTSVFEALAYSGIAFLIACTPKRKLR